MEKEIMMLNEILSPAVAGAIAEYTNWYIVSSITAIVGGLLAIAAGVYCFRKREEWEAIAVIASVILIILGLSLVFANIPDLANPKAKAIHQLLKDARGGCSH